MNSSRIDFIKVLLECYGEHLDLLLLTHSFPTRRSSDLVIERHLFNEGGTWTYAPPADKSYLGERSVRMMLAEGDCPRQNDPRYVATNDVRSEEHTSELQSLMRISYAVFCLIKKRDMKPSTYQG